MADRIESSPHPSLSHHRSRRPNTRPHKVQLCIVQPPGYLHALGFLDQARFFRYQFRRLGADVTLGKNRLHHDAINFVFGAHVGFDADTAQRYECVFVNLEQLGGEGAKVPAEYLELLAKSRVVDYDPGNVGAYRSAGESVPIVSFAYAPYLATDAEADLPRRPIDLMFYGSVNERRQRLFRERSRLPDANCRSSNTGCTDPSAMPTSGARRSSSTAISTTRRASSRRGCSSAFRWARR